MDKQQIIFLIYVTLAVIISLLILTTNPFTDYEDDFLFASSIVYSEINQNSTSSEIITSIEGNCKLYSDYPSSCEEYMIKKIRDEKITNAKYMMTDSFWEDTPTFKSNINDV